MSTLDRNETIVKHDSRIHSATATQYRFTLHVPTLTNSGGRVNLQTIEDYLLDTFGAFTQVEAVGVWRSDDGTVYTDPQMLYHIDAADDNAGQTLRQYAAKVRDSLSQECVYVTRQQITTWLV